MLRRTIAPILRLLAFLALLASPLVLAAIARAEEPEGKDLVALRSVVLGDTPADRFGRGGRVAASAEARLLERNGTRVLVSAPAWGTAPAARGWADSSAFFVLDDPLEPLERLVGNARLLLEANDRPVLAAAYLHEVTRRDASRIEAWELLGRAGELLAATARPGEEGREPASVALARVWGVTLVPNGDRSGYRYDGAAYRRLIALAPPAETAERARLRLLTACGPVVNPQAPADADAASRRERDLAEFLASFPASPRRVAFLLERARLLSWLAEGAARRGDRETSGNYRDGAIEAASEVTATAPDAARRRAADRLVARLTKSLPRKIVSDKPVVSSSGLRAQFVAKGRATLLVVTRPDGKDAIQPYTVVGADPASLAFDSTGRKLVWDEAPAAGRRRTRLLDLTRAQVIDPAASAEPELLPVGAAGPSSGPGPGEDRYTTSLGFSPDGRLLLVVSEGFTPDGVRIPKRHVLCDTEGTHRPVLVDRPYSAPGVVDWNRLQQMTERLSG
ncbi:MAG TPA: hypothetical protein VKS23_01455 [Thermoanaerobaculia bacterium]|nr:hypothetical protein [Thermoanaerobaculia bacterium]